MSKKKKYYDLAEKRALTIPVVIGSLFLLLLNTSVEFRSGYLSTLRTKLEVDR